MQILIRPNGNVCCVYDERIDLRVLGNLSIRRGSHVEPDAAGRWHVDLSPIQGPRLGPFALRSQALAAELSWIERHWLTHPQS